VVGFSACVAFARQPLALLLCAQVDPEEPQRYAGRVLERQQGEETLAEELEQALAGIKVELEVARIESRLAHESAVRRIDLKAEDVFLTRMAAAIAA
jgi:hypothetical protein